VDGYRIHFPQNRVRPILRWCAQWARYHGRSGGRALCEDRPFCRSQFQFRNGPHSSSSSYGRRLNWSSEHKGFLVEILQHLHRLRNRSWWRAVESSGAEEYRRSGRKPTNQHGLENMMRFRTRRVMPWAATAIRVTQFVSQMNNFHHPRISLSRLCLEVTFPLSSYVTTHVGT
jgi:hypothetical protein